ncbi:hypothetical protein HLPCO_000926 [Haloplasma contractile SSD-17B]|uniref:Uncharacterized protein n=1 Tax=Haloplasma contractile SSD-17B TaxID=1033810 RepID=F7PWE5_9MOLU|nr:hypothetical protein HLPCO_000926 [Haloplasma contractile SSD-17B]
MDKNIKKVIIKTFFKINKTEYFTSYLIQKKKEMHDRNR